LANADLSRPFELSEPKAEVSDIPVRLVFWLMLLASGVSATDALELQGAPDRVCALIGKP
jgi:hypothetical protein